MNRTLKLNHFYFHLGFSIIFTIYYLSHSISRHMHSSNCVITDRNLKEGTHKLYIQPFNINTIVFHYKLRTWLNFNYLLSINLNNESIETQYT